MINPNYDITGIKTALYEAFSKTEVSKNVFMVRPATTDKITDFVVIRMMSDLVDWNAYGKLICRVELYAKDVYGGENAEKLSAMFFKSEEAIKALNDNPKYTFSFTSVADRGADGLGFHSRSIDLKSFIKTI